MIGHERREKAQGIKAVCVLSPSVPMFPRMKMIMATAVEARPLSVLR